MAMTLEQAKNYMDSFAATLACWDYGANGIHGVLVALNVRGIQDLSGAATAHGDIQRQTDLRNAVATASMWALRYMRQGPDHHVPASAVEELWTAALCYSRLQGYLTDVDNGHRAFQFEGKTVRLPYVGNRGLYAVGSYLGPAESKESTATTPLPPDQSIRLSQWRSQGGVRVNWFDAPDWAREPYRCFASGLFSAFPADLATDTGIHSGFTTDDLKAYQLELASFCLYESLIIADKDPPDTSAVAPVLPRDDFVRHMREAANIKREAADRITQLLTMDSAGNVDPALTPLVPLADALVPMSGIISLTPQRPMLEVLKTDAHRGLYGEIGNVLGDEGEDAVAELLAERMPNCKVGKRIRVTRKNGDDAGDLDVVLCSPSEKALVVFETKWGISVERSLDDDGEALPVKRQQVRRLQREIGSEGTKVHWPIGWPNTSQFDWRWVVVTRYTFPEASGQQTHTPSTSHQQLKWTLPRGASIKDLLHLICNPPIPNFTTRWETETLGQLEASVEVMNEPTWRSGHHLQTGATTD
ncbi:MAG: hypothetical protein OXM62_03150 [bacterium]|nr:hypothetical protein [bacterium]MDE0233983.1 hypothetical protein [bacterium]